MFAEESIRFRIQGCLCITLTNLVIVLETEITADVLGNTVQVLFDVLSRRHRLIYEEAVLTLASLFMKKHDLFANEHKMEMLHIVAIALDSGCPGVINAASILLADMYRFSGSEPLLVEQFHEFFQLEVNLLRSHREMREIHPFAVKAIAEMFEGTSKASGARDGLLIRYEEQVLEVMKLTRDMEIDVDREEDIQYANSLFEHACMLYKVYADNFYARSEQGMEAQLLQESLAKEKMQLLEMARYASVLLKLGSLTDSVLYAFCKMTHAFGTNCSRKNNVILNRNPVHRLLEICQGDSRPPKLKNIAKTEANFLKSK
jgi:hypothetical protein